MEKRVCFVCHKEKPIEEFYRDKSKPLGRDHKCMGCCRILNRERDGRPKRVEKSKQWLQSDRGKQLARKRIAKDYALNKNKYLAQRAVRRLIKMGVIVRQPCEKCGNEVSNGHHPDYSRPLMVLWLCQRHHSEEHRK